MHDERTEGRGYLLPHPENLLIQDVDRLRQMIRAVDEDYTALMADRAVFQAHADEVFEALDAAMEEVRARQDGLEGDSARQLQEIREEVGDALRKAEGRVAELETRSGEIFADVRREQAEAAAEFGGRVDGEILRLQTTVPRYDNLEGTPLLAASTLPRGHSGIEYVSGLGFFRFSPDAADPPDGETCISPAGGSGRWLLVLPDVNWVTSLVHYENVQSAAANSQPVRNPCLFGTASLDFGAIAAGQKSTRTIFVAGAAVGDLAVAAPASPLVPGLVADALVTGANTVSVECRNLSGGAVTPAAMAWSAAVFVREQGDSR